MASRQAPPSAQWQPHAPTNPQYQGGSSRWNQGTVVQRGPPDPKGYDGAGRPYYTTQVWRQSTGWQDDNGSQWKRPWDAWSNMQEMLLSVHDPGNNHGVNHRGNGRGVLQAPTPL
eukprot:2580220-Prorocentrum_lima.AAC.1